MVSQHLTRGNTAANSPRGSLQRAQTQWRTERLLLLWNNAPVGIIPPSSNLHDLISNANLKAGLPI